LLFGGGTAAVFTSLKTDLTFSRNKKCRRRQRRKGSVHWKSSRYLRHVLVSVDGVGGVGGGGGGGGGVIVVVSRRFTTYVLMDEKRNANI